MKIHDKNPYACQSIPGLFCHFGRFDVEGNPIGIQTHQNPVQECNCLNMSSPSRVHLIANLLCQLNQIVHLVQLTKPNFWLGGGRWWDYAWSVEFLRFINTNVAGGAHIISASGASLLLPFISCVFCLSATLSPTRSKKSGTPFTLRRVTHNKKESWGGVLILKTKEGKKNNALFCIA